MHLKLPPPLVFLVATGITYAAAASFPAFNLAFAGQVTAALLTGFFGLILDLRSIAAFFRAKTTVNPMTPQASKALVTSGFYRVSRNPMYLGLLLLLVAISLYLGSPIALVIVPAFIWYLTEFQIKPEERRLAEIFGQDYENYRSRVRRWI